MRIEYAIHSSDSNSMYLDFWPVVSKIWKLRFGVTPVLVYIDENHDIDIDDTFGEVVKYKPVDGIPLYLQTLWVRYWYPTQKPNNICILSDIDMLPLSKPYFVDQIENIPNDFYVHLNSCIQDYGTLPSCYHVAKGSKYKEVLQLHDSWEDSINHLHSLNKGHDPGGDEFAGGKDSWFADETYATEKVVEYCMKNKNEGTALILRNGYRRIDRSSWSYDINLLMEDYYHDSHSIRPYKEHKEEIDKLVNLVLSRPAIHI